MSKRFLTSVIAESARITTLRAGHVAADVMAAIKRQFLESGRFTLPEFGSFTVRATKARIGRRHR